MAFLAGLGGLTGFFSNQPGNRTTTQTGSSTGSTNVNYTQSQPLTPYQQNLESPLFSYITQLMTPGGAESAVAPFTAAARDSTNSTYSGLADTLRQQFMSTGNGQSGKYGNALVQGNLQRLGALQGVDAAGQEEAAQLPLQASTLAAQMLEYPFEKTTSGGSTTSQSGTSTTVGPGSPLAGLLQGLTAGISGGSNQMNAIVAALLANGGGN